MSNHYGGHSQGRGFGTASVGTFHTPFLTLPNFMFEKPAVAILLPVLLGSGVGWGMQYAKPRDLYKTRKQPPFNPPGYVFGPVWTLLYGLMGYASYRAFSTGMNSFDSSKVLAAEEGATLYTVQLGLNLIWMPLFFGLQRPIAATVDIVALTGVAGYLTYVWGQIDEVAAWCMVPYLGWLGFATYLCAGAGYLNDWDFSSYGRGGPSKKDN